MITMIVPMIHAIERLEIVHQLRLFAHRPIFVRHHIVLKVNVSFSQFHATTTICAQLIRAVRSADVFTHR
jgi:hypothetical protein